MADASKSGLLVLESVSAGYREAENIVEAVSFDVQRGEVAALTSIDSSGGKSTIVRVAAGLLPPTAGRVHYDGLDVYGMGYFADQRLRGKLAVVLQGGALLVNRTVWENVCLPLRYHQGKRGRELRVIVESLLAQCGYNEDLHALPWQVSARGRRLAAFARALALDPDMVIVDRFYEGLEMPDWRRLFELVMELNQKQGVSWLLVSELDPGIFQVAERVGVLEAGRLIAYDFKRSLYRTNPRIQAAFEAVEQHDRRSRETRRREALPDSERILIVDSNMELDAVSSSSDLTVATPSGSAGFEDLGATINIDGRMPQLEQALEERKQRGPIVTPSGEVVVPPRDDDDDPDRTINLPGGPSTHDDPETTLTLEGESVAEALARYESSRAQREGSASASAQDDDDDDQTKDLPPQLPVDAAGEETITLGEESESSAPSTAVEDDEKTPPPLSLEALGLPSTAAGASSEESPAPEEES